MQNCKERNKREKFGRSPFISLLSLVIVFSSFSFTFFSCSNPSTKENSSISASELNAIVEGFALVALSQKEGFFSPSMSPLFSPLSSNAPENCSPQKLTPPLSCKDGGNIYFTLNLSCNGPSGCCGNENPCGSDEMRINGQGSVLYNSCATTTTGGDRLVINGSLFSAITTYAQFTCSGIVTLKVKVTLNGIPSIRLNGKEVCNGTVFLTADAIYSGTISVRIYGTVCGEHVDRTLSYGCMVSCGNNMCCPAGSYCGTCSTNSCLPLSYPVDCCNGRACPSGTRCVQISGETKCQY